jgi:hypothetical protein
VQSLKDTRIRNGKSEYHFVFKKVKHQSKLEVTWTHFGYHDSATEEPKDKEILF